MNKTLTASATIRNYGCVVKVRTICDLPLGLGINMKLIFDSQSYC
jgi:hypothetical protein